MVQRFVFHSATLLGAAIVLLTLHGPALAATPAAAPVVSLPAAAPRSGMVSTDGSFPVTLTLNGSVSGLQPDVARAAWLCSARILSQPAIDAEMTKLGGLSGPAVRTEFSSFLEYRAHYLGQQSIVEVPLSSGSSGPTPPISVTLKRDDLVDPATRRAINQPAVLIGCWLQLTDAAGHSGFAALAASPMNLLQVTTTPWVLSSASIPNE